MAASRYAEQFQTLRRFLVIIALAFWLGGFTFYASVVIHTGHRVFGNRVETGFLTQQVTLWLNRSGAIALAVLFLNALVDSRHAGRGTRTGLWLTWAVMVSILVALYFLHPRLDAMLDTENHHVLSRAQFRGPHKLYMNLSTTQWAAGLLHLWFTLVMWRRPQTVAG